MFENKEMEKKYVGFEECKKAVIIYFFTKSYLFSEYFFLVVGRVKVLKDKSVLALSFVSILLFLKQFEFNFFFILGI